MNKWALSSVNGNLIRRLAQSPIRRHHNCLYDQFLVFCIFNFSIFHLRDISFNSSNPGRFCCSTIFKVSIAASSKKSTNRLPNTKGQTLRIAMTFNIQNYQSPSTLQFFELLKLYSYQVLASSKFTQSSKKLQFP